MVRSHNRQECKHERERGRKESIQRENDGLGTGREKGGHRKYGDRSREIEST
jgi:hypothetical protein